MDDGVDQRQVGERLGEVAQMPSGAWLEFLGEQSRGLAKEQPFAQVAAPMEFADLDERETNQNEQMVKMPSSPERPSSVSSTR